MGANFMQDLGSGLQQYHAYSKAAEGDPSLLQHLQKQAQEKQLSNDYIDQKALGDVTGAQVPVLSDKPTELKPKIPGSHVDLLQQAIPLGLDKVRALHGDIQREEDKAKKDQQTAALKDTTNKYGDFLMQSNAIPPEAAAHFKALNEISPSAASSFIQGYLGKNASEQHRSLQDVGQALSLEAKNIKPNPKIEETSKLIDSMKAMNIPVGEYGKDPQELVAAGYLNKKQASEFATMRDQLKEKGVRVDQPGLVEQGVGAVKQFFGGKAPAQQVDKDAFFKQLLENSIAPNDLQKYQQDKQKLDQINQHKQQLEIQQSQLGAIPKSGNQKVKTLQSKQPAGEVERLDPASGKTAVFDGKTKKFLRWK